MFRVVITQLFKANISGFETRYSRIQYVNSVVRNATSWSSPKSVEIKQEFVKTDDPDTFGTLTGEDAEEKMETLGDVEGDKIEYEITDDRGVRKNRSIKHYASLIKQHIQEKNIVDALDVLETKMLKEDRAIPDYYIYNLLINGCARAGYALKAFKLYSRMKERCIKPTPATYTGLFNACANSPFPEDALMHLNHLRKTLSEKGIELTLINYNALIKGYARLNDIKNAFVVVDEMISKGYSITNETFCFLFQACISDKEAGFRHSLVIWHKMLAKKSNPTLYNYNLLLRSIRECGLGDENDAMATIKSLTNKPSRRKKELQVIKNEEKEKLLSEKTESDENTVPHVHKQSTETLSSENAVSLMENVDNRPNLLSKNPHFGTIVKINEIKTPQDRLLLLGGYRNLFDQMKKDKVKPNIKTFTIMLDVIPSTLSAEQILIEDMKKEKVEIDIDFCNMLIKKRALRSDYHNAREVLKFIQSLYLEPDIVTFGVLAMACQYKHEALELINDMNQFGYRLNPEIMGAMLKQACFHFRFPYVIFLLRHMKKLRIQPNEQFMEHLSKMDSNAAGLLRRKKRRDRKLPGFVTDEFAESYAMFKEYYDHWKETVEVFKLPHPYEQFSRKNSGRNSRDDEEDKSEPREKIKFKKGYKKQNRPKTFKNDES